MEQAEAIAALKVLELPEHMGQVVLAIRDIVAMTKMISEVQLHGVNVGLDLIHKDLVELTKLMKEAPIMRVQSVGGGVIGPGGLPIGRT